MPSYRATLIDFNDLKPEGALLNECAGGIGIDSRGRVYFSAQDDRDPQDVVLFRYTPATGKREMLATARGLAAGAGNLGPNEAWPHEESIAKIHCSILEHGGRMYFATHNFADPTLPYAETYDQLQLFRGAHLFAYDLDEASFADVTRAASGGVAARNQSIAAMTLMPGHDKIVMFTFPCGDLIVHDLRTHETRRYDGHPRLREDRKTNIAREIIATAKGSVFISYAAQPFSLCRVDLETGVISDTGASGRLRFGYLSGMAAKRDGSIIYLVDLHGNLYAFDTETEEVSDLGNLLLDEERRLGKTVTMVHGLVLSADEKTLYTVPSRIHDEHPLMSRIMRLITSMSPRFKLWLQQLRLGWLERRAARRQHNNSHKPSTDQPGNDGDGGVRLYGFDLATGTRFTAGQFDNIPMGSWVTGNGVVDSEGRLYFCYHTLNRNGARLVQLSPLN